MSQAGINNLAKGPVPPSVANNYTTDVNSPAVPSGNNLNVVGDEIFLDRDEGIYTDGGSGSDTLTIYLTNRVSSEVTTSNATPTNVLSQALGGFAGCFNFEVQVVAYNTTDAAGGGYSLFGTVETDGGTATLLGTSDSIKNTGAPMDDTSVALAVSGNSVLVQVTGLAGKNINWKSLIKFAFVGT